MKKLSIGLYLLGMTVSSLIAREKPNIVFILADDLGYESINAYGANTDIVRTPNIDNIAERGIRFTNAHTPASICSPTRYGLLTGEYPWRSSLKFGVVGPVSPLLPDPNQVTLADWLKDLDYNTAVVGKWHLGHGNQKPVDFTAELSPGPLDMGFDYYFGVPHNHGDIIGAYIENEHVYGLRSDKVHPYSMNYYGNRYIGVDAPQRVNKKVMEVITNKAIDWLRLQSPDKPFFLYFAPVAVHDPITPSDYMRGMSDCGPYGDFIQDLDWSVGKVLTTLRYNNLMDNTIIVFTSDNGGDIPKHPQKPHQQAIKKGLRINGSFRGDKHTIWEGGTRVPFIFSWPGHIEFGSESKELINLIDVFATVCDITRGSYPESIDVAPDSYSFLSYMMDRGSQHNRSSMVTADLYGIQALRKGKWKYIDNRIPEELPDNKRKRLEQPLKPELYNLANDPGETNNVYDEYPEKAKELRQELHRIRNQEATRTSN